MTEQLSNRWRKARLAELGEVNRGRSRHRPRYASHLYGGSYPFIQTGDIRTANGRITHHTQTYSEAGLAQSRLWPAGTLCITIAANIAETAILTYPACFPDSVVGFIADESKCDVYFIELMFRTLKRRIQLETNGSVQDNINLGTLDDLWFMLPLLPEQHAIAHILGTLDDKIELNRKMNQTLDEIARTLFTSWFVTFDPVRAKTEGRQPDGMDAETAALFPDRFADSELGSIPEGWEVGKLGCVFEVGKGGTWGTDAPIDGSQVPAITLRGIDCHRLSEREDVEVQPRFVTDRQLSSRLIPEGTVLVEGSGSFCGRSLFWFDQFGELFDYPVSYSNFVKRLDPLSSKDIGLVAWLQVRKAYEAGDLSGYRTGTAFPNFDVRGLLVGHQVIIPSQAVASRYFDLFQSLQRIDLLLQNRTLSQIRDMLLPELLSGRIGVPDAEQMIEAL